MRSSCNRAAHAEPTGTVDTPRGVGILATVLLGSCALFPGISAASPEVPWDRITKGLAVTVWTPGPRCGGEVPGLLLVKVNPERFRFATYHFRDEGLQAPLTIQEWQRRTGASILFNAGQFSEDYSYLGLLFKKGRSLGSKVHPRWKGLFVAEPLRPGLRKARVVDLWKELFPIDPPPYQEAAQSLMLFDATGKPRVRQTGKRARQTVIGEDLAGNILVIKTVEPVALWELAVCLRDGLSELRHAMVLDGGSSSDLLFASGLSSQERGTGPPPLWQAFVDGSGTGHVPLPAVIGISPR